MDLTTPRRGGRKRTGMLIRSPRTRLYSAKAWLPCEACKGIDPACLHCKGKGERRQTVPLNTDNPRLAARLLRNLLAMGRPPEPAAVETFEAAAERVHEDRKAAVKGAADELARLRRFAFPEVGTMPVTAVETRHVNAVLDAVRDAGKSRQTCAHVLNAMRAVFGALRREGVLRDDPAEDAQIPAYPSSVKKERAVLTDEELARYLAWAHPDKRLHPPYLSARS